MDEGEYKIRQRDRNWKWSTRSRDSTTSRLVVLSICYHIEQLTNVMQATRALFRFIKAAFHYSSKLQTWLANLVFDQVCSQVFDKFVRVCDMLSTFFVENLVPIANLLHQSRQVRWFVRVLDKWNIEKIRFEPVSQP